MSALGLTDEQAMFLDVVAELAGAEVAPLAGEIDREGAVPEPLLAQLAESELATIALPEELGGADGGAPLAIRAVGALAQASAAVAVLVGEAQACVAALAAAGEAPQGELALVDGLESGHVVGAARAERLVVLDDETAWTVPAAGAEIGPTRRRTGLRGCPTSAVRLCEVRREELGGAEVAAAARAHRLLALGAAASGVARRALADAREHTAERRQFGRPLAEFGAVAAMLEDCEREAAAAEAVVHAAAAAPDPATARRAARTATVAAVRVADDALQLHGGYGYVDDHAAERLLRDAVSLRALAGGRRR